MSKLEISKLLQDAKDASIKVFNEQEVSTSDLESIFKVVNYNENELRETLSSNVESVKNKLVESIVSAADLIVDYMYSTLLGGKDISEIFIEDVLHNGKTMMTLLNNPHSLLSEELKFENNDAIKTLNNKISIKVEDALSSVDQTHFDKLSTEQLEDLSSKLDSLQYLDDDIKDNIRVIVSGALFGKIAPELENFSNSFSEESKKAINKADIDFNAEKWKDGFTELVRKIEANSITRGSPTEKYMEDCKKKFESLFDDSITALIKKYMDTVVTKDLEECETIKEINEYRKNNTKYQWVNLEMISQYFDDEKKTEIKEYMKKIIEDAKMAIKSRPPRVKKIKDKAGNEYVKFKDEVVPVAHYEKKKHKRRMEPKRLADGNIVLTFRDLASDKVIEPSMAKRLRIDYPYEMTAQEWKKVQRENKTYQKKLEELEKIKGEIEKEKDEEKKKELIKKLQEAMQNLPFFARVLDKLSVFDEGLGDYIEDKIPEYDEQRIKITPDIMENLREMAECSKTMLKSQHDILILEGEAGVGKNVIIDIFAHFTHRPVFVFSCGKRTDVQDLTYLWILDENGSKRLNSKIFEAIHTPGAILVLDEINTLDPGIQKRLNGLLDARKSLVVDEAGAHKEKAEESVLIFGTMNPQGYSGTQPLAADVRSRAHFLYHDYDRLLRTKEGGDNEVSYSDALKMYGNVKYFWKLAAGNGFTQSDVELYEEAILDQLHSNRLTPEKKKILKNFKPISDSDFIWAWNCLFNGGNRDEVKEKFGDTFISGMEDLFTMMLYANYIRIRYKASKEHWEDDGLPRDEDTDSLFEDISFSPRLAIQALEQLHNGGLTAKEAVIETFVGQLTDVNNRPKVIEFFDTLSVANIERALINQKVQKHLSNQSS